LVEKYVEPSRSFCAFGLSFFLYIVSVAYIVSWLHTQKGVSTPYTRKIFHFLIFTMAAILHIACGLPQVIVYGTMVSLLVIFATAKGEGFGFYEALARPKDEPHRTLLVLVPLFSTAFGGLASNLISIQYAPIGYLIAGWGDAVGEPVGAKWGNHQYRVLSFGGVKATRSLEGSLAVFLMSVMVAFLSMWFLKVPFYQALTNAILIGLLGTAIEAVSSHGIDNLTIQVAVTTAAKYLFMIRS